MDDNDHVLVSCIDEEVTYGQAVYQIGTHKFPNTVYPAGYKLVSKFNDNPIPTWIYKLGNCELVKEILMPAGESVVMVRYTVSEANRHKVKLLIRPYMAFRPTHALTKANLLANKKVTSVNNGIMAGIYEKYTPLYLQTSQKAEFVAAPDWYYNFEYPAEQARGYEYAEDLFTPGHFSVSLRSGDKVILYIGLDECNSKALSNRFTAALKKQHLSDTVNDCLFNTAKQFIIRQNGGVRIKAGYHWFGTWGRDTFISLPGLLLTNGHNEAFIEVINSSLSDLYNGLLPNVGSGKHATYNSVDASLWFIWALHQYAIYNKAHEKIWQSYGSALMEILNNYAHGTLNNIKMDSDGLVAAGTMDTGLTWMDAVVNGKPVTPRNGKAVEINALWYNAVCFCIEAAGLAGDGDFVAKWENYPAQIQESFIAVFWDQQKQYLADCVSNDFIDWSIRPNQVFALSCTCLSLRCPSISGSRLWRL